MHLANPYAGILRKKRSLEMRKRASSSGVRCATPGVSRRVSGHASNKACLESALRCGKIGIQHNPLVAIRACMLRLEPWYIGWTLNDGLRYPARRMCLPANN